MNQGNASPQAGFTAAPVQKSNEDRHITCHPSHLTLLQFKTIAMHIPLVGKVSNSKPWLIGLATVGLLAVSPVAYLTVRNATTSPDISNLTTTVNSESLTLRISANGTVRPIETVNLSPKAAGILAELYVEQGDQVEQGQIIARMESADVEPQLMQARASVAQAEARLAELQAGNRAEEVAQAESNLAAVQAQVREAQARLDLATERLNRNRVLEAEGAISQDDLNQSVSESQTARASLEQAQARVQEANQRLELSRGGSRPENIAQARAQVAEAVGRLRAVEVQQADTVIRAPFSGIITQRYATEGAFVTPTTSASSTAAATSTSIVALARGLEVLAEVPEADIGSIRLGQMVEVVADAFPNQTFGGKVKLIAPEAVVEQNVTSFQVQVELLTGQEQLRSGMNVDLMFLGEQLDSSIVVPTVAIVTKEGQTGVLIPNEKSQPEFRPVTIGSTIGNQTQILEGIQSGDRIFVELPEGQKLEEITQTGDRSNRR